MIREILALGLSNDKEHIDVKTALCFSLIHQQIINLRFDYTCRKFQDSPPANLSF